MAQLTALCGAVTRRRNTGLPVSTQGGLSAAAPQGPGRCWASVGVVRLAISFGADRAVEDDNQIAVDGIVGIDGKAGMVERMTRRVMMLRDMLGAVARSKGAGP